MNKIKKDEIIPISKNFFVIKKIVIFLFLGLSILIGALSIAVVFGYLFEADWFLSHKLGLLKITINFLPFFWIIFLAISVIISYFNFKNTDKGYKFYLWQIILINILASFIIGILFYFSGLSQFIEEKIQNNLPNYREYLVGDNTSRMKKIWQNEESGLLLGIIVNLNNNKGLKPSVDSFKLKDTNNKVWNIKILKQTIIRHNLELKSGIKIKLIGEKKSKNIFEVIEIRPFMGNLKGYQENHKK
ncbi:MAG: hypothetical protein Q9M97_01535 [Candidatus Gracilibacteria bacterium]|nr:hypothetical protein [Candidatus Gracilibacteria bacterium]